MSVQSVSPWEWAAAVVPLAAILYLLVGRHWKAATAAPVGYFLAALAAATLFGASDRLIALETVKGVWDALFILYVVVPALLLYRVAKEAGTFDVLRRGIEAFTPNDLLHVLAFGWVFSSFLQGITGFGVPVVVTAPLLVAMGVTPAWAVAIPLIGHAWANTFGTLAVAWEGLVAVTDLAGAGRAALLAALMLGLANLLGGLTIAWLFGRGTGVREGLPAVVTVSAIHGIGQVLLAPLAPTLSVLLPGTVALGAVFLLGRTRWYRSRTAVTVSQVMQQGSLDRGASAPGAQAARAAGSEEKHEMPLRLAMLPYLVLIALIFLVRAIPPVRDTLAGLQVGLAFPGLETGRGVVVEATEAYRAFAPLAHPGTYLLVATLLAFVVFRRRGDIRPGRMGAVLVATLRAGIPTAVALFALIPLAKVMEGSGQTTTLAHGISAIAPGPLYALLAPLVGVVGAFMTSSNLSSNILFGPLQEHAAGTLGVPADAVLAAQTAGAAVGNSIAPGNVLLGAGTVGIPDRVGAIIRLTLPYVALAAAAIGVVALAAARVLPGA